MGDSRPISYIGIDNLYVTSLGRDALRRVAYRYAYTLTCRGKARNGPATEESRTAEDGDHAVTH